MIHQDIVVYLHPDGSTYVARFEDAWYRWPAERNGWQQRVRCSEGLADACSELEPRRSTLALRLSGVSTDG